MKFILLTAIAFIFPLTTIASTLVVEENATITICQKFVAGCANRIVIQGKPYLISYDEASNVNDGIKNLITEFITAAKAVNMKVSPSFKAEGFIVKEKGHFPNPVAEFEVFKLSYVADVFPPAAE